MKTPLDQWMTEKIGLTSGTLTRQAIEQYQLVRLRQSIALAKEKSASYRSKLADVEPDRILDISHLAMLPFTFSQEIKEHPTGFVCTSQQEIERIVSLQSSGTTGRPLRIYFTKADQDLTVDFFNYGMRNLVDASDRVLILLPWESPGSVGDLLRIALNRLGAKSITYGPVFHPGDAIETALRFDATAMVGIPTHVLGMARHPNGHRLQGRIRNVLLTTDYVPDAVSGAIAGAWGCRVFNHYGMTEMGLGGAVQCAAGLGCHLREGDLYFEIVHPETGSVLPDGELGEIVFTTLTRQGMPLIRYRTGDLSRFIPKPCPCGSVVRSMEIVRDRVAGRKKLAGMTFSLAELDEVLFKLDGVLDYQCELSGTAGRDCLGLHVVTAENRAGERQALDQAIQRALQTIPAIRDGLKREALSVEIDIDSADLPVTRGTAKRQIIDKRE